MGNSGSQETKESYIQRTPARYSYVSLFFDEDQIIVFNGGPELTELATKAVEKVGAKVKKTKFDDGVGIIKVKDMLFWWFGQVTDDKLLSHKAILAILEALHLHGWMLLPEMTISGKPDRPMMFFKKICPENYKANIMELNIHGEDVLTVVNAPNKSILDLISEMIMLKKESSDDAVEAYQSDDCSTRFVLQGQPWSAEHGYSASQKPCNIITTLLEKLTESNLYYYGSCHLKEKSNCLYLIEGELKEKGASDGCLLLRIFEANKIAISGANPDLLDQIRQTILETWTKGFYNEAALFGTTIFSLNGSPWSANDESPAMDGRRLMLKLLSLIDSNGYELTYNFDTALSAHRKNAFLFQTRLSRDPMVYMAVSLSGQSSIRLIDCPGVLARGLYIMIVREMSFNVSENMMHYGCNEIIFDRSIFHDDTFSWKASLFLCRLLHLFNEHGLELLCCSSLSSRKQMHNSNETQPTVPTNDSKGRKIYVEEPDYVAGNDCLFFRRKLFC